MNPTKTISQSRLAEILLAVKGAQPITISALVDARARKTGNPFAAIFKLSKVNGFTGANYEASVNRQHDREGSQLTFAAKERSWGERISPALVRHESGKLYAVIQIQRAAPAIYLAKTAKGLMHVSKESVEAFLPAHKPATNQGTDKEIVYRNYGLDGIAALSIGGQRYRIRHDNPAPVGEEHCKPAKVKTTRKSDVTQEHEANLREEARWPEGWDGHK